MKFLYFLFALALGGFGYFLFENRREDDDVVDGDVRTVEFERPIGFSIGEDWRRIAGSVSGDYWSTACNRDGDCVVLGGDYNRLSGGKDESGIYRLKPGNEEIGERLGDAKGKGSVLWNPESKEFQAITGKSGSLWKGWQHPQFKTPQGEALGDSLQTIPELGVSDVNFSFVQEGAGAKYQGDEPHRMVYIHVNKQKFTDYRVDEGAHIGLLEAEQGQDITKPKAWKRVGVLKDRRGEKVGGIRGSHVHEVNMFWHNPKGTYFLLLQDFFAKTFEVWYWDRACVEERKATILDCWHRLRRFPDAGTKHTTWQTAWQKLNVYPTYLAPLGNHKVWAGFWRFKPIAGTDRLSFGGWPTGRGKANYDFGGTVSFEIR